MPHPPKRLSTRRKYRAVQKRFKELYDKKRLRYDDCIKKLQQEFFISHPNTVMQILNTEVPDPDVIPDPNQMSLF